MVKTHLHTALFLTLLLAMSGCAQVSELTGSNSDSGSNSSTQDSEAEKKAKAAEEDKAIAEAEAKNTSAPIPADSIFAKINIGMSDDAVTDILGKPGQKTSYRTGKSWIPFAGRWLNDRRRQSWFYENTGVIVMSQNSYSRQYSVVRIDYNANQSLP
ncbi:hypothetical protein [Paraglaciecola arctica]|uniref:Lipoprotein SmpA/OmlA domain-containing protein n=1 Tax=Paraglaciecola arctica BSs20135 TaxID=493475 RepID=K6YTN6_9ALTE|nr:hypothetical protein [Paraglaciecola arctica]GAC21532.1 hypothetical protein GARC_4590 [Paraglaciecola arctica BSs20135]